MAVNTDIATISKNPALNGPDGGVDPPSALDDAIRNGLSFTAKLRDGVGFAAGAIPAALGYTPVQQGTGPGQISNTIKIGWSASNVLRLAIDNTDLGSTWPINITGNAGSATNAANAANATTAGTAAYATSAGNANSVGSLTTASLTRNDTPVNVISFVWDGSKVYPRVDGTNQYMRTNWNFVDNRPTLLSQFLDDVGYVKRDDPNGYSVFYDGSRIVARVNGFNAPVYTTWAQMDGKPEGVSNFVNDSGYVQRGAGNSVAVGAPDGTGVLGRALPNTDNRMRNITVQTGGLGVIADGIGYTWAISASDERLKKDIAPTAEDSLAKIQRLQFRSFAFNDLAPMFSGITRKSGLIAQEAELIDPDWITEHGDYKQLNVETLLTSALHAVQQLTSRVKALEAGK